MRKKLVVMLMLMLLVPVIAFASQLGVKTGGSINEPNALYESGVELILGDGVSETNFLRIDFEQFFVDTKMRAISLSIMVKPRISSLEMYTGIGAMAVIGDRHGIGPIIFIGIEPKINELVSFFTELKFNNVLLEPDGSFLSNTKVAWGLRFKID